MIRNLTPGRQDGIVLLEALAAILVFSFGILAFLWMQASATRQVTDSKYRLEASFAANQILGEMWVHPDDWTAYVGTDVPVTTLPAGKRTVALNGRQVTVTISWKSPGESKAHSYQAVAQING
ncbi:type IV pilus modification PilV family protein [Pseudoduganella sp. R-34]|uniref:type IV pilus modification PilV family protein n=1 Tax=unclassified Pseudoduganella TaxID=2637179 RepID=UPI003CF7022C